MVRSKCNRLSRKIIVGQHCRFYEPKKTRKILWRFSKENKIFMQPKKIDKKQAFLSYVTWASSCSDSVCQIAKDSLKFIPFIEIQIKNLHVKWHGPTTSTTHIA